jgi:hypothetical protein
MLQKEFEERVGMKVTPYEYGVIETLYNDSDLEKDEFCAKWKKNDRMEMGELNANTITTLNKRIFAKNEIIEEQKQIIENISKFLMDIAYGVSESEEIYEKAVKLIGRNNAIIYKMDKDYTLTDEDKNFIKSEIQ